MNNEVFEIFPELDLGPYKLKALTEKDLIEIEELCSNRPASRKSTAIELLHKINTEYKNKSGINWGIYFENLLVGSIGFYRGFANNEAEIGYELIEKHRNKGIATLAVNRLVKFAFEKMEIQKVKAYTSKSNIASHKVLAKANFKEVQSDVKGDQKFEILN